MVQDQTLLFLVGANDIYGLTLILLGTEQIDPLVG